MDFYSNLPDELHYTIVMASIEPHSVERLNIMEQIRTTPVVNLLTVVPISKNQKDLILGQISSTRTLGDLCDDALLGTKNFDGLKMGPRVRIRQYLSPL